MPAGVEAPGLFQCGIDADPMGAKSAPNRSSAATADQGGDRMSSFGPNSKAVATLVAMSARWRAKPPPMRAGFT
jgi:hypothetical protein